MRTFPFLTRETLQTSLLRIFPMWMRFLFSFLETVGILLRLTEASHSTDDGSNQRFLLPCWFQVQLQLRLSVSNGYFCVLARCRIGWELVVLVFVAGRWVVVNMSCGCYRVPLWFPLDVIKTRLQVRGLPTVMEAWSCLEYVVASWWEWTFSCSVDEDWDGFEWASQALLMFCH